MRALGEKRPAVRQVIAQEPARVPHVRTEFRGGGGEGLQDRGNGRNLLRAEQADQAANLALESRDAPGQNLRASRSSTITAQGPVSLS